MIYSNGNDWVAYIHPDFYGLRWFYWAPDVAGEQ
jgi:hypothetical protein